VGVGVEDLDRVASLLESRLVFAMMGQVELELIERDDTRPQL